MKPKSTPSTNGHSRIFGYVRASDYHQIASPEKQQEMIREKARELERTQGAHWMFCRGDIATSATKTRWNNPLKRPELNRLLDEMQRGDHLIIWRLDRLERHPFGMVAALEHLVNRGIQIHILEHAGMQLDLDTAVGKIIVMILAGYAGFFSEQLSHTVKSDFAFRRAHGLAIGPHPLFGRIRKKRSRIRLKGERRDHDLLDVWDDHQCDLLREIWDRRLAGQAFQVIAKDFFERQEMRGPGRAWVIPRKPYGHLGNLRDATVRRHYYRYCELLAEGKDLKNGIASPEDQAKAIEILANRGKPIRKSPGRPRKNKLL